MKKERLYPICLFLLASVVLTGSMLFFLLPSFFQTSYRAWLLLVEYRFFVVPLAFLSIVGLLFSRSPWWRVGSYIYLLCLFVWLIVLLRLERNGSLGLPLFCCMLLALTYSCDKRVNFLSFLKFPTY